MIAARVIWLQFSQWTGMLLHFLILMVTSTLTLMTGDHHSVDTCLKSLMFRMWRKNRSPPPQGSSCYGVDLNRNWDVIGFGLGVVSANPCSETYKVYKLINTPNLC